MKGGVIIVPTGTVTPADRERANEAGYCIIECDSPDSVRLLVPEFGAWGDDIAMSALEAIQGSTSESERSKFAQNLFKRMKRKEEE